MSIDLRTEKPGGTWTRRDGEHEAQGFEVSLGNGSAHVTLTAHGIMFAIDRRDIPAAWESPIDVVKLRSELIAAIIRYMSAEVLEALFGEIHHQRQRAFWDGNHAAKSKIKEALGL
jgi:hypothetical protein